MASPMLQTKEEENTSPVKSKPAQQDTTSNRRVLEEVSPNVKKSNPKTAAFLGKALTGSPLKRSFTAAMEGGDGLAYLKRRKLSEDEVLSQFNPSIHATGGDISGRSVLDAGSFRPLFQSSENEMLDIPLIIEASPTEPNTPSENDSSSQGSAANRKSFSSLINYDPSSQTSTSIFKTVSNAEMLKLRLRVAMYKVRTNQINTPFLDLKVGDSSRASPVDPNAAIEAAVEQLRSEAREIAVRDQLRLELAGGSTAVPKLGSPPVLRPTAYSSRMIYKTHLPSSPPGSSSPERLPVARTDLDVSTPLRGSMGFESPSSDRRTLARPREQELTSSVVKGRVAEGLLGLRHAV